MSFNSLRTDVLRFQKLSSIRHSSTTHAIPRIPALRCYLI